MSNLLEIIAALMWIALAVYRFCDIRKWNRRFGELYDTLKEDTHEH